MNDQLKESKQGQDASESSQLVAKLGHPQDSFNAPMTVDRALKGTSSLRPVKSLRRTNWSPRPIFSKKK